MNDENGALGTRAECADVVLVARVREALARLHDPANVPTRPQLARQHLLRALEALRPLPQTSPASRAWRPFRLLWERYVEARDTAAVQRILGLGKTQYHAEHTRALRALAEVIAGDPGEPAAARTRPTRPGGSADRAAPWDPHPTNLAQPLSSFVGRARHLAEVTGLLRRTRLLTLVGPGGGGKTRLAWRVGAEVLEDYPDGVWATELAPAKDPSQVIGRIARALRIREEPGQTVLTTVLTALRSRRMLLILDNCEHVLDACAELSEALLHRCDGLTILATSREALGVAGEMAWHVHPLEVPGEETERGVPLEALGLCESVRLFLDRAAGAAPGFSLTPANSAAVAQICRQLDGIPLALELAAARISGLAPKELAARLDRRFDLLTDGCRTALPRHRTLGALVEWSYGLLSDAEQRVFCQLSAFAGGFTLEAAELVVAPGVANDGNAQERASAAALVLRLVRKSLVVADTVAEEETRYRLLETLRQFAAERLDEQERGALAARHAGHYLAFAEVGAAQLRRAEQLRWLDRLDAEHENVVAALRWLLSQGRTSEGLRLAAALGWHGMYRGRYAEARTHLAAALAEGDHTDSPACSGVAQARVAALGAAGILAWAQGDHEGAEASLLKGRALAQAIGDRRGAATCATMLSSVAHLLRDQQRRLAFADEALGLWRGVGDAWGTAWALARWGNATGGECYERPGDVDQGGSLEAREQAVVLFREVGDRWGLTFSLISLSQHPWVWRDRARAEALLREALAAAQELGNGHDVSHALSTLGLLRFEAGEHAEAAAYFYRGIQIARERGLRRNLANLLTRAARVAVAVGELTRARHLLDEASGVVQVSAEAEFWWRELRALLSDGESAGPESREVAASREACSA